MKTLWILPFFTLLFTSACVNPCAPKTERWTTEMLHGLMLEQDDPKILNRFSFMSDGLALSWIGEKGGVTASPVLNWWIDERGRLLISNGDGIIYPPLQLIRRSGKVITAKIPDGTNYHFLVIQN